MHEKSISVILRSLEVVTWRSEITGLGIICDGNRAAVHTAVLLPRRSSPHGILLLWDFSAVNISNKESQYCQTATTPIGKNVISFSSQ